MKLQKLLALAVTVAAFAGGIVGVVHTRSDTGALKQDSPRPTVNPNVPPGDVNAGVQQQSKPELEVRPGDSETIKALKTELKELRQRVDRLEYETKPRIRPIVQR
jgi:hypothetical protein